MLNKIQELLSKNKAEYGILYVVATPIGNLGDLSFRSICILSSCDLIACETPNITKKLLSFLSIEKKNLFTYRDSGEEKSANHLVEKLLKGTSIALVSDAGTPTISDPGFRLIKLCHKKNIRIIPIPGPSAAITALSASGFPSDKFIFLGFLPVKKSAKQNFLRQYSSLQTTLILYESPHRILSLFECLIATLNPTRNIFVARELTKLNETLYRGQLQDVYKKLLENTKKGEYVVIIAPENF